MRSLLLLLTLILLAGCDRRPAATATFQYNPDATAVTYSPQVEDESLAMLRGMLPAEMGAIRLRPVVNTSLFQLTIWDPTSGEAAAKRANDLVQMLKQRIEASNPKAKFVIWEQAAAPPQ